MPKKRLIEDKATEYRPGGAEGDEAGPKPELTVELDDLPGSPEPEAPPPAGESPAESFQRAKRTRAKPAYEGPRGTPIGALSENSEAATARAASEDGAEAAAEEAVAETRKRAEPAAPARERSQAATGEEDLPLDRIAESPTNPREDFEEIAELAESIRKGGQYHAITVRPNSALGPGMYEVAFGARRVRAQRLNAEKHGGPATIRALIRPLTDREVDELHLDENLQRKGLKPLEEGAGYERLHATHGMKYSEIAARFKVGSRVVYNRVKLLALGPAARKALNSGEFNSSIMLEVACRPTHGVQEEILREFRARNITTLDAAQELLRTHFAYELASAPFDTQDPFLAPAAGPCPGACAACPHNTSNQKQLELGGQPPRAGVCTSPDGYRAKRDAHLEREQERAKAAGVEWLKPAEAKRAFEGGTSPSPTGPYVGEDQACAEHPKRHTWARLLGKDAPKKYAAADSTGKVHFLYERAEAVKKARSLGTLAAEQADEAGRDEAAELKARRKAVEREEAAALKVVEAGVAAAEGGLAVPLLRAMCLALLDAMKTGQVEQRRGRDSEQLKSEVGRMKEPALRGLALELAFAEHSDCFTPELLALAKALGLERRKLEKEVEQAELALKGKAKAAEDGAKPPPKRRSRAA